jgi:hypothetical protein
MNVLRRLTLLLLIVGIGGCGPTSIVVDGWAVSCGVSDHDLCHSVAALAINNLGRNRPTGLVHVAARPVCPAVPAWADRSQCWQVYLPVGSDTLCMVIAKGNPGRRGFGQVAGDEPGRSTGGLDLPTGCPS